MMIHDSCYATNNLDILRASEFGSFYPVRQNCVKTLVLGSNFDENTFTQDELGQILVLIQLRQQKKHF